MKKSIVIAGIVATLASSAMAQKLELRDLTSYRYMPKQIHGITPSPVNPKTYTIIKAEKEISAFSFADGKEVEPFLKLDGKVKFCGNLAKADGDKATQLRDIDDYIASPDGKSLLLQTNTKKIYRHSFTADFYLYNRTENTLHKVRKHHLMQEPTFSPDGKMIAYVCKNNLHIIDIAKGEDKQITSDGKFNHILNGIPDWVNEEEFAYSRAYDMSADSKHIAWIRFDESKVKSYSMPMYKGFSPSHKENALYPGDYTYKYPKAGEQNATVKVLNYNIEEGKTSEINVPLDADGYIPRIMFTAQPGILAVTTLNRHQSKFCIYLCNVNTGDTKLILEENAKKYIPEETYANLHFYKNCFVLESDRDGYKHLYLYDLNGKQKQLLTKGNCDVTDFYGYDEKSGTAYYQSTEGNPLQRFVVKSEKGKKTVLTPQKGTNKAIFSTDFAYFINTFSNFDTPHITSIFNNKGKSMTVLADNYDLKKKIDEISGAKKEFFTFKTSGNVELNGYMIKPYNFDKSKKYPVIMYQYSGPGSQQVLDSWNTGNMTGCLWERYMADKGFVMVCVDGRGTGGRGADFEKCTYLRLGEKESEDQVEAALYLASLPFVDKDRIGIWGWSFGGFNTLMAMSEGRNAFACGVAVAPPTDWRFYDTIYTERYMQTPQENAEGYNISPIGRAKSLHGNLLICHGLADDNVHFQNTAEYQEILVQLGTQFESQYYTNRNHSIYGGSTRLHLYTRIENFFVKNLMK